MFCIDRVVWASWRASPYLLGGQLSRPMLKRPVCISDIIKGYKNMLEILANCQRVAGITSSSVTRASKIECLASTLTPKPFVWAVDYSYRFIKVNSTLPSSAVVEQFFSATWQILIPKWCTLSHERDDFSHMKNYHLKWTELLNIRLVLQFGIHCLTVCVVQLLDQSSFDELWKPTCLPVVSVSLAVR